MAKTKKVRRYYKKSKWSSNIKTITNQVVTAPSNASFFYKVDLCKNPAQSDNTVSQIYTVKNITFNWQSEITSATGWASVESLVGYIMYVPQGMTVTETYPNYHPEYIMGCRFYGSAEYEASGTAGIRNPLSIKTRLARRLNTGDSIVFLLVGSNTAETSTLLTFNGLLRWWTKAN